MCYSNCPGETWNSGECKLGHKWRWCDNVECPDCGEEMERIEVADHKCEEEE